jgi:hypothetical protein
VPAFDLPDLTAQGFESGRGPHSVTGPPGESMFLICSPSGVRESRATHSGDHGS